MQVVSDQFETRSQGQMRPVSCRFWASFDKTFNDDVDFFTIGVSTVGGADIIQGEGEVVQEWDKYEYTDYSDRVISIEWSRLEETPHSMVQAIADVTVDNHDDFFTPSETSVVLPGRPVKLYAGFGGEDIPVFVGVTESLPEIDEKRKTAKFHCIDFLNSLVNKPLDEEVIYEDMRVDEVIGELLQSVGILPSQYDLDVASTTIPFAYFARGTLFGEAVKKLVQADLGSFYMTETGVIRYRQRQNFEIVSVHEFNESNVVDLTTRKQSDITNVVEVRASVREVQAKKVLEGTSFNPALPMFFQAGHTREVWVDFTDPVTSVDEPEYEDVATTSEFTANLEETGVGTPYSGITLTNFELFSTAAKMTFNNSGGSNGYLRTIVLQGTPAEVVENIYIREQDDESVDKYNEKILSIDNDFIQDQSTANSLALLILAFYAEPSDINSMRVKGTPAFQLADPVTASISQGTESQTMPVGLLLSLTSTRETERHRSGDYYISKIECGVSGGEFRQTVTVRPRLTFTYFTIGVSEIAGPDVIAP